MTRFGFCPTCGEQRRGTYYWTPERIVAAMVRWADEHEGTPPTLAQWGRAEYWFPNSATVIERFGSWNAGIAAAGFTPRKRNLRAA